MYTVFLNKLKLYGYHGWHESEKLLGGEFEVSVTIQFETKNTIELLSDTIDYVAAYESVKKSFSIATPLLETLAQNICRAIANDNPLSKRITVSVSKLNTPIINFEGQMGVTCTEEF